ncbi:GatB/YqeY domain-containing protein [uncultured Solobacterium sp.]|uniref:GatB/YqeY domain-containing protein n=1 Tax=uncultured Solobacterium sp. TaxID=747375 RepID=UPI0028E33234|nr:GatB/YqeY domain-containing protein [uncultured Solobacterium sp.]
MGELLLQLRKDNMKAMKEHDTLTKGVLSLVISAITLAEKEAGHTLEKNDELAYIQREIKQTNETIESIPENRADLKEEAQKKLVLLSSYLPKQLTEEEIHQIIEGILQEKGLEPLKRNQGPVMREILDKYKGQTDGKTVNRILSTILH